MKKLLSLLSAAALLLCLISCGETANPANPSDPSAGPGTTSTTPTDPKDSEFSDYDFKTGYDEASAGKIVFDGTAATATSGAAVSGGKVTITKAGTYLVSGTATEGQLVINVDKAEKVHLVLNGVDLTCAHSAPIYVMSADKVKITLAEGTTNKLTDGTVYTDLINDTEPTGCLFSKDDLTINGKGTLSVTGNYNNGIACKNDLHIVEGTIFVKAVNHGLKGKDSVAIAGGHINISAGNDGIKANEAADAAKGYIKITGGEISILATDDGLQAVTGITITGGKVTVTAGGKATNCEVTPRIASGSLTVVGE